MCRIERNDTNELIYKTKKDSQTWKKKTMLTTGKGDQGGIAKEFGIDMYTLLHYNGVLLSH